MSRTIYRSATAVLLSLTPFVFSGYAQQPSGASPGSIFNSAGRFSDLARDLRAGQVHDLVTVLVSDQLTASSQGTTNTGRKSSVKTSITALAGQLRAAGPWANLANLANNQQLQGQGTTSRQSALTTSITAEVLSVLPSGNLVIQAQKEVWVNSERQVITLNGVVRPADLNPANQIPSDRVAGLQIHVNGKGVVADAVRRPNFLYRLLLGLLPF